MTGETSSSQPGLLGRALAAISLGAFRRPRQVLAVCATFCVMSLVLAYARLELQMDWTYLFYPNDEVVRVGQPARDLFPIPGDIVVLVDHGTEQERATFIDRLAARIQAEPETFHHLFYRFDLEPLASKALYYLDEENLRKMLAALEAVASGQPERLEASEGPGRRVLLKLLRDLEEALRTRGRSAYVPIWEVLTDQEQPTTTNYLANLLEGKRYVYATIGKGDMNLLAVKAGTRGEEFAAAGPLIDRLREILDELSPSSGNLRIRLTGLPVMLHDERATCERDGTRSSLLSLILVILVFAVGFGELKRPLLAAVALTCGMIWTVGFTTVAVGHLNFISVTLATMLMGVGIDFGIHFIFRYDEEMGNGHSPEKAIEATLSGTGVDTLVGAGATATAFLGLTLAQFRGISDFGIIAAGGTMLCFLSTIVVLPALLALFPGRSRERRIASRDVAWLERALLSHSGKVVLVWLLMMVVAGMFATRVGFSYNLLEIQAQEISSVRTEMEMIRETKSSVLSAEAIDLGQKEARRKLELYSALPTVARVGSLLTLLPPPDESKQRLIEDIVAKLATVELPAQMSLESADDLRAVRAKVKDLERQLAIGEGDPEVEAALDRLRTEVRTMDPGPIQDGLSGFQSRLHNDLATTLSLLKQQRAVAPVLEDLPSEMRLRYVSPSGHFKQMIQPSKDIWQKDNLDEFLGQLKSIDPQVIGHPVIQDHILSAFNRTLERTPVVTLVGVLLVFAFYLRSPRAILLSLTPAGLAVLMIFGVMGALGLDFNVVSFVGLPISVGLGAVYGVHSLHRMQELNDETVLTSSTGPALLLSGVTDIVGFASLTIADHRGIGSLGLVISIGVGVSFVASLILLPALQRLMRRRK